MQEGSVLCALKIDEVHVSKIGAMRHGVCHRCGWRGEVVKIRRQDRRRLKSEVAFGRLCQECATELSSQPDGQSLTMHDHQPGVTDSDAANGRIGEERTNESSAS
jgi:hypothetical protein